MMPAQLQQFNTYGCVSRSLIRIAAIRGHQITPDDFCNQFQNLFVNPANQYGGLITSQIVDVVRGLNLGTHFLTYRRYGEVDEEFNVRGRSILVVSEINLNMGAVDIVRHCSVLTQMDAATFTLHTPSNNGQEYALPFQAADWDNKLCHAIVIV
jgi:hypothetical protein